MRSTRRVQFIWSLFLASVVLLAVGSPYGYFLGIAVFWLGIGVLAYSLARSRPSSFSKVLVLVWLLPPILLIVVASASTTTTRMIEGSAMEPTLDGQDRVVVSRYSMTLAGPERGDLVVFSPPTGSDVEFVKRLIGIPGDEIDLDGQGVFVNGEETAWVDGVTTNRRQNIYPVTVPPGEYFFLGDNRRVSVDSRNWGFVPESSLHGKITAVYFPLDHFNLFP